MHPPHIWQSSNEHISEIDLEPTNLFNLNLELQDKYIHQLLCKLCLATLILKKKTLAEKIDYFFPHVLSRKLFHQRKYEFVSKSYIDNLLAYNTLVGSPLEINNQHCL